jgi:hypothetical protein
MYIFPRLSKHSLFMFKTRTLLVASLLLFCFSCNKKHPDENSYFFISSTCETDQEDELIVNMDSVFIHRFILKAPYSQYPVLLKDSSIQVPFTEGNPFLMFRFSVVDSSKEDIEISGMNLQLFPLYDGIPGDKLEIHGIYTGNFNRSVLPAEVVGKQFSDKDTIRIKSGTVVSSKFMIADYELKEEMHDATSFLLRTQLTIKYKNAYNLVDTYDTIVRHDRWYP